MQKLKQMILLLLTISASGISFLTSLVVAKIYQPTEFGEFAYYFATATILSGFLSLKIDTTALTQSELNGTDKKLILAISIITLPTLLFFESSNILLTFILAASMAAFTSNAYSLIPKNKQTLIGVFKLALAISIMAAQVSIQYINIDLNKLLLGAALANTVVSLLFTAASRTKKTYSKSTLLNEIHKIIKYRVIISKNFLAWAIETLVSFAPIIIITTKFNVHNAGLFAFSEKLFRAPTAIIISSIIPFAINKLIKSDNTIPTLKKYWAGSLVLTSPLLLTPILAKPLILYAWGEKWSEAIELCIILFPLFIFQTIITSTNFIFNKTNKLHLYSTLQAVHLIAIYISITYPDSILNAAKLYAITSATFYVLIAALQIKLGKDHDKIHFNQGLLQN